jgi:UDP-N-acetylmuramoylalanine--D-glutamate ligase
MIDLKNKNVLVVGLGKSGLAVAKFLKKRCANPVITDYESEKKLGAIIKEVHDNGIPTELGGHRSETFVRSDLIILSPGVSHKIGPVCAAREKGIPIWGEIEFASRFISEPVIAITGTNGKTTTTTLTGEMLENSGFNVFVGGNIGNPLIEYADSSQKADVIVAEVSSFQLDTIETFKPKVSVLLNIAEDHLDRYTDFSDYARSKEKIFKNQSKSDFAILNGCDPLVRSMEENIKARKYYFNAKKNIEAGAVINCKSVFIETESHKTLEIDLNKSSLEGKHNYENIAAAALSSLAAGANIEGIKTAVEKFKGLPHRLEYVATVGGIKYFDDSKATNTGAVIRALQTFETPVILIMGGRDKGGDYGVLEKYIRKHVKLIVVAGEASEKIISELGGILPIIRADSLNEAVLESQKSASSGDTVLLSPACSSFDMFENYHMRGEAFQHAVKNLKKGVKGL